MVVSTIGGGSNENLAHLVFGLEVPDPETEEDSIMEEVRLVMTPRTLKLTQHVLTNLVQSLEAAMGEIPLGPVPAARIKKE